MTSSMLGEFLFRFIEIFFDLLVFAIIARVLFSWMPSGGGKLRSIIYDVTEPVLGPFRNIVPRLGVIDISPIIAIIVLDIVKTIILQLLVPLVSMI